MTQSLTLEIHHNSQGWLEAASIRFISKTEVELAYDLDYASTYFGRKDCFALSLAFPVDTQIYRGAIPGFILDLIPQGEPLKRLMGRHSIREVDDFEAILSTVPLASPGNIRIKEPWQRIEMERPDYHYAGFTRDDVVRRQVDFVDYMESLGAPIGGTTGAGGGSPKFLLREDGAGKLHAEGMLDDSKTMRAYLVKLPFTDSRNSVELLHVEKSYYDLLRQLPLSTGAELEIYDNVLFITRFDRERDQNGVIQYHGLESLYSAHNIIIPGARLKHEDNIRLIAEHSTRAAIDVAEYLKRDLINKMLANTDNHGRNTSFIKKAEAVGLSPLYDVTAMRFFMSDFIVELTKWEEPRRTLGQQIDWIASGFEIEKDFLVGEVRELVQRLGALDGRLRELKIPEDFILRSAEEREATLSAMRKL